MSGAPTDAAVAWTVDFIRAGDEAAILALFNLGFGKPRSMPFWRWRFAENPYGGPLGSVARLRRDGTIVGAYLFIPFQLWHRGEKHLAAQGVDLVVHPNHRKQGMFEQMARDSYDALASRGFRAQVAFPNPGAMSYPGFTRTLAWPPLCALRRSTRRLDLYRALSKLVRFAPLARGLNAAVRPWRVAAIEREVAAERARTSTLECVTLAATPADADRLWQECREQYEIAFVKDADYLRWRYDRDPDETFGRHALMHGGQLVALAITHERDDALMICELLVSPRVAHAQPRLLAEIAALAMRRGLRSVSLYGSEGAPADPALRAFVPVAETDNVLVGIAFDEGVLRDAFARPLRWTITYGDPDFV